MKSPRRDSVDSFGIDGLLVVSEIRGGIRLTRNFGAAGREPRNHVADILLRHRPAANVTPPIGRAEFRTAGDDDRAQALVAHQGEEGVAGNGAALRPAVAVLTVA